MADLGYYSLVLAFLLAVYAFACFILAVKKGNVRLMQSAKGAVYSIAILISFASLVLLYYLVTSDFSIKYVAEYTNRDLPLIYKISAFWAGNAGSMLFWLLLLTIYTAIVTYQNRIKDATPIAAAVMLVNIIFFSFLVAFIVNPFETLPVPPTDGNGLNPQLQNTGMILHPTTTYLGYVGFAVPFAFAMAALILRRSDDLWIKVTRRWTIIGWMFLSLGNIYGAQWAYVELGWGGYWAWDPVENASFIPWLTGSAFLHSVMIQERKNMLKIWNVALIIVTYVLTLFGTFLVRSGILSSVHAFAENPYFGKIFLVFIISVLTISLYLMFDRLNLLKEEKEFESYVSKESSFLLNNLVLLGIAFAVFLGTVFPLISEAVRGVKVTVSTPFFNTVSAPLGLLMVLLIGICPLIAWHKSDLKNLRNNFLVPMVLSLVTGVVLFVAGVRSIYPLLGFTISSFSVYSTLSEVVKGVMVRMVMTGENVLTALARLLVRNRRRYGGYIIHFGLIMIVIGIIGSNAFVTETQKTIKLGESISIKDYTLKYYNLAERKERGNNDAVYAQMEVSKGGKYLGVIEPQKVFYQTHPQPSSEVAIKGSLKEDLYVILGGWEQYGDATFKVLINPLIAWIWLGGYVMVFGTIFALWPGRGSEVGPKYIKRGIEIESQLVQRSW